MEKYVKRKKYNKLIRDKIPEILEQKGVDFTVHTASDVEYKEKLKEKLREEVDEFLKENNVNELADVLEVVYALADDLGINREELETIRKKKAEKRGAFKKKIILDES